MKPSTAMRDLHTLSKYLNISIRQWLITKASTSSTSILVIHSSRALLRSVGRRTVTGAPIQQFQIHVIPIAIQLVSKETWCGMTNKNQAREDAFKKGNISYAK